MAQLDHYNNILDLIDPETVGVIWFDNEKISKDSPITRVFNYLIDGRLDDFIDYSKDNDLDIETNFNFFVSKSFNSSIIISNFKVSKNFSGEDLKSFEMILDKVNDVEGKNILVVHPEGFEVPKIIKKSRFKAALYSF